MLFIQAAVAVSSRSNVYLEEQAPWTALKKARIMYHLLR